MLTYEGSHIVRAYCKKFKVDILCALNDLGEIGALSPEKLETMKHAEQIRQEKRRQDREEKRYREVFDRYPDADDHFFYIAGYTSGGAPYGVTWEEMGMEPWGGALSDEMESR